MSVDHTHHEEGATLDYFGQAANSFQIHLDWIEQQGRKDAPDWHLANGLLRLAQGLQQEHEAKEGRLKSFARSLHAADTHAADTEEAAGEIK